MQMNVSNVCVFFFLLQDVLNNLGSSELDEDDLMLDLDLSDDQRHRHGNFCCSMTLPHSGRMQI